MATPVPAPPPLPPPPPPPAAEETYLEEEGQHRVVCSLKELCLGPVLTLGVVNVFGIGAHARYGENLGFGLDFQFFPTLTISDVSASWWLLSLQGRWFPFGGAFWLGGGFGMQSFSASTVSGAGPTRVEVEGTLTMPGLQLGLGFMGREGFIMGIDLAFTIPLGGSDLDFSSAGMGAGDPASEQMIAQLENDLDDAAKAGVKLVPVILQINLLRIGYLF